MNRIEKLLEFLQQTPGDNFLKHALALEYIKLNKDEDAQVLFESILKLRRIILVHIITWQNCMKEAVKKKMQYQCMKKE